MSLNVLNRYSKKITYSDGSKNEISVWEGNNTGVVRVMIPAMGVRASYYNVFAECLTAKKGGVTITTDLRGLGKSSIRASRNIDFGYEDYIQDLEELTRKIRSLYHVEKTVSMGHSLGGQLACLHASRNPQHIQHIVIFATCLPFYKSWKIKDRIRLFLAGNLFYPLTMLYGYFPGHIIGFAGKEARMVMKDWTQGV